eukprot:TRINITY_DN30156_c0_g2_i2.p1 TRINITY_DN30156_c0_g2~~TRINITY_DN30156_c0_g2_i2.p1  ORF type:complete len:2939 (+),score=602.76 TRINITY_DN30156_c0_g2_i2:113-8929(+)
MGDAPKEGDGAPAAGGDDKAAEGGGEGGAAPEEEEEEQCQLAKTQVVSEDAFYAFVNKPREARGTTKQEHMHWSRPRRWDVRLWDLELENVTSPPEKIVVFFNFIFGGTREEFLVYGDDKTKTKIWVNGIEGYTIRTEVIYDEPGDGEATPLHMDQKFEWHGSYLDLEEHSLRIETWNWSRWRVNKLDSVHTQLLVSYAKGAIYNEVYTVRTDKFGFETARCKLSFRLFFQEIYDFELEFKQWRSSCGLTCKVAIEQLCSAGKALSNAESMGGNKTVTKRSTRVSAASARGSVSTTKSQRVSAIFGGHHVDDDDEDDDDPKSKGMPPYAKKLFLETPGNPKHHVSQSYVSTNYASYENGVVDWSFKRNPKVYFRGSVSDFNNASLTAMVVTKEKKKTLDKSIRKLVTVRKKGLELSATALRLKGALENTSMRADMLPAPWFYDVPGGELAGKLKFGRLEGNLSVANHPRFKQTDDANESMDFSTKRYLFVKVLKIDAVVTPGTQSLDEIDTFVNVSFDGEGKRTRVCQNDISPSYNEELVFELKLSSSIFRKKGGKQTEPDDTKMTWEEIGNKGHIFFDVWMEGLLAQHHLGRCEVSLPEIIQDERGQSRAPQLKASFDAKQNKVVRFPCRVMKGCKRLHYIWGEDNPSHLYFEAWFMKDISELAKLKEKVADFQIPMKLDKSRITTWLQTTQHLTTTERSFPYRMKSQWSTGPEYYLPRFLDGITPPSGIQTCTQVLHYIGSIPYNHTKTFEHAMTPDFFSMARSGDTLDHALLHASYLIGLGKDAYVCLGNTLLRQRHAWVITLERDGSVICWEPFLGFGTAELKHRLAHPEVLVKKKQKISHADQKREVVRRKRLIYQNEANVQAEHGVGRHELVMPAGKAPAGKSGTHEHPLVYMDCAGKLNDSTVCKVCSKKGKSPEFVAGFSCLKCSWTICWDCAEPGWGDSVELENIEFDVTTPVMFHHSEDVLKGEVAVLPYMSVEIVFNKENLYVNLQDQDPAHIYWDVKNSMYFHCFDPKIRGMRPCFNPLTFYPSLHDDQWCQELKKTVVDTVCNEIKKRRINSNMVTVFVRNPLLTDFLVFGLQLEAELEQSEGETYNKAKANVIEFRRLLQEKTPPKHKLRAMAMRFNYGDPAQVAEDVLNKCHFVTSVEKQAQFAIAAHILPLPGDVVSFYFYVIQLVKLSDFEVEDLNAAGEVERDGRDHEDSKECKKMAQARQLLHGVNAENEHAVQMETRRSIALATTMQPMKGFIPTSPLVTVEKGGLVGRYIGPKDESSYDMQGVLLGDGYLVPSSDDAGSKYFEITVTKIDEANSHGDGLAIGVTLLKTSDFSGKAPPPTAADMEKTWAAGFNGAFWNGPNDDFAEILWNPTSLAVGDTVGFLIEADGHATVYHNQELVVFNEAACIPFGRQLFAVVDLLGTAMEVELNPKVTVPEHDEEVLMEAKTTRVLIKVASTEDPDNNNKMEEEAVEKENSRPPPQQKKAKAKPGGSNWTSSTFSRFDAETKGANVDISEDGLLATFSIDRSGIHPDEEPPYDGLAIGSGPIPINDAGEAYFEIVMERVRGGMADGLGIGVTTRHPPGLALHGTIDQVDPVWAVGFDGVSFDSTADAWVEVGWNPASLQVGDRVGCLVDAAGSMTILVNDSAVASGPTGIPRDPGTHLCAVFDLLGGADCIRFVPSATERSGSRKAARSPAASVAAVSLPASEGPARSPEPAMTGFYQAVHSPCIVVSQDGLRADLNGERGGVIGDNSLRKYKEGWYFEIEVDVRGTHGNEGLSVGVTTCAPTSLTSLPEVMEEVEPSWLVGFDGAEWDGGRLLWGPALWTPSSLKSGDRVGVMVTRSGELRIAVNGTCVHRGPVGIPCDKPLYALVDLAGTAAGVSFLPDTAPPGRLEVAKAFQRDQIRLKNDPIESGLGMRTWYNEDFSSMRSFSLQKVGACVALSPDGLHATYMGTNDDLNGGLISDGPIVPTHLGMYFEVRIDKVSTGAVDGLAIGVTITSPDAICKLPESLDTLKDAWLVGFDGASYDGRTGDFADTNWFPKDLVEGDRVGVLVEAESGDLVVYVNGEKRLNGPRGLPCEQPLFALVDLVGNTDGVTLLPLARSPSETASELPPKAELPPSLGFARSPLGAHVSLSADGVSALRSAKADPSLLGGVVLGEKPIQRLPGVGHYYEVKVSRVQKDSQPDGIAVGVTTRIPHELSSLPDTADQLSPSWLIGFDGATWDSTRAAWGTSDWDTRKLAVNDVIGVLVDFKGQLVVFVNGAPCCTNADWPRGIPVDQSQPLYPIVDLLGHVSSVSLRVKTLSAPRLSRCAATRGPPKELLPMRGFDSVLHGAAVTVASDGLSATRGQAGRPPGSLDAVLIGDGPLEADTAGGVGFELQVDEVITEDAALDGLAVGFTTSSPWELRRCPETADQIERSWLIGYDGAIWDGALMQWFCSDWSSASLQVGDRIRVRASSSSELVVVVNDTIRARHVMRLPGRSSLFALVDLVGSTTRVSLQSTKLKAQIEVEPSHCPQGKAAPGQALLSGFYSATRGQRIRLASSTTVAQYTGAVGVEGEGVVLSNARLHPQPDGSGVFYTLTVRAIKPGSKDGLAVGVTSLAPGRLRKCPTNAELVEPSWLVGFDGATWNGAKKSWGFSDFNGTSLRVGDVLSIQVTQGGALVVLVNGKSCANHDLGISAREPLFAVVDLAGAVSEVEIGPASPPSSPKSPAASSKGSGNSNGSNGYLGFMANAIGKAVKLDPDRFGAKCDDPSRQGIVITDAPLWVHETLPNAVVMKLWVRGLRRGPLAEDGFSVGVTTLTPTALSTSGMPDTADMLSPSWLVGLDGAFWDGFAQQWDLSDFKASDLQVGDTVLVVVAKECEPCEMTIMVNGIPRAKHPMRGLPTGAKLFGLVDLTGSVGDIVLLSPGQTGPASAPKARAKGRPSPGVSPKAKTRR